MKKLLALFFFIFALSFIQSQMLKGDELLWSHSRKLTAEDFQIKKVDSFTPLKSTFILSWELNGFGVFNKNFNKNITNKFIKSASIIDENSTILADYLEYQQTSFDMAEIYARKMREDLFLNKSKLWKGFDFASEILKIRLNEYYKVQAMMDSQTNSGTEKAKLEYWKEIIAAELLKTEQFNSENEAKINIKNNERTNPVF
ncbi:hypothetical protein [Chryseobacterium sp. MP_3.2]|uniref:hypothetical protein n=1 Tax=Chryseobacterium sp. MP_3.2 TaxID=3071712 RepID=UPI002DF7B7FD|nr:hypothetical protein [Chryseobacterium sp. MP_3.2]